MDNPDSVLKIPDGLYLDLRLWMAEYLPSHIDQIERLEEMRQALALGCIEHAIVTMHLLGMMARYRPGEVPRGNDRVRQKSMALLPELIAVAEAAGRWTESDQRDCDEAWRAAYQWVMRETAKDRARAQGVEVA